MNATFQIRATIGSLGFVALLSSCAFVEMSGTMTRKTGEIMEDYSKKNDGVIAKGAGFGGRINKAVGSSVEDIARKGKTGESNKSLAGQYIDANKKVITAASDAAGSKPANGGDVVLRAQKRLQELGYDIGPTDGVLGAKTKSAVSQYQLKNGLQVTNMLDNATLASLKISNN